jgi:hypothetical protein
MKEYQKTSMENGISPELNFNYTPMFKCAFDSKVVEKERRRRIISPEGEE